LALVTNQGKPLDPTEEAGAFRRFTAWGLTIQDIARRIGRSDEFIRQRLALVDASPEVRQAVKAGEISIGQGVRIVKSANGNLSEQRAALDLAPKKNERQPRLPLYDRIVAQAQKLPRGKVLDLIGRLNLLVDEMKEKEAAEN
jgi:hypothetical protein